jgi:hypothetical protein
MAEAFLTVLGMRPKPVVPGGDSAARHRAKKLLREDPGSNSLVDPRTSAKRSARSIIVAPCDREPAATNARRLPAFAAPLAFAEHLATERANGR